ncbi:MAG TPA: hypothetical protein VK762_05040 [Polyangiaceae bacterium]|jgi:hypothetical protein|nr:hypothetical protein [Polyangiaceae bacterium]
MVSNIRRAAITGVGSAVVLAWASSSFAEDTGRPEAEAPGITATRTFGASGAVVAAQGSGDAPAEKQNSEVASPSNLFVAGVVTFTLSYLPALMSAGNSSLAVDRQLYVPVAGPWLDLAMRPNCGPGSMSCNAETVNQGLLIADGFFQGLAVVQLIASLGALAHDSTGADAAAEDKSGVHVRPAQVGRGAYGLAAIGKF